MTDQKWVYKNELARQAGVSLDCISNLCKQYEKEIIAIYPQYTRHTKLLPPNVVEFLKNKYVIT